MHHEGSETERRARYFSPVFPSHRQLFCNSVRRVRPRDVKQSKNRNLKQCDEINHVLHSKSGGKSPNSPVRPVYRALKSSLVLCFSGKGAAYPMCVPAWRDTLRRETLQILLCTTNFLVDMKNRHSLRNHLVYVVRTVQY